MDLEGDGQSWDLRERGTASGQQGTGSGQQGTVSGQLGLGSETRGEAEDRIALQVALDESARDATIGLNDNESSQESDEDDRQSQAASLANTADTSMDLVIIMPDKIPVCFLCSFRFDYPFLYSCGNSTSDALACSANWCENLFSARLSSTTQFLMFCLVTIQVHRYLFIVCFCLTEC